MQPARFPKLLQHELAVPLMLRRRQALRASCNLDRIGIEHADALQELAEPQLEPVVETPYDCGIAVVLLPRRIEVKDLLQDFS